MRDFRKEKVTPVIETDYELLLDEDTKLSFQAKPWSHLTMWVDENYNLLPGINLVAGTRFVVHILSKEKPLTEENSSKIIIYGTSWCGGTSRVRRVFEEENIEYKWMDIDRDETAARFVESVANGFRSVPTIVFPDGSVLVEPSTYQLREKLGL